MSSEDDTDSAARRQDHFLADLKQAELQMQMFGRIQGRLVAVVAGCSPATVRAWVAAGHIKPCKPATSSHYFSVAELTAFMATGPNLPTARPKRKPKVKK